MEKKFVYEWFSFWKIFIKLVFKKKNYVIVFTIAKKIRMDDAFFYRSALIPSCGKKTVSSFKN